MHKSFPVMDTAAVGTRESHPHPATEQDLSGPSIIQELSAQRVEPIFAVLVFPHPLSCSTGSSPGTGGEELFQELFQELFGSAWFRNPLFSMGCDGQSWK